MANVTQHTRGPDNDTVPEAMDQGLAEILQALTDYLEPLSPGDMPSKIEQIGEYLRDLTQGIEQKLSSPSETGQSWLSVSDDSYPIQGARNRAESVEELAGPGLRGESGRSFGRAVTAATEILDAQRDERGVAQLLTSNAVIMQIRKAALGKIKKNLATKELVLLDDFIILWANIFGKGGVSELSRILRASRESVNRSIDEEANIPVGYTEQQIVTLKILGTAYEGYTMSSDKRRLWRCTRDVHLALFQDMNTILMNDVTSRNDGRYVVLGTQDPPDQHATDRDASDPGGRPRASTEDRHIDLLCTMTKANREDLSTAMALSLAYTCLVRTFGMGVFALLPDKDIRFGPQELDIFVAVMETWKETLPQSREICKRVREHVVEPLMRSKEPTRLRIENEHNLDRLSLLELLEPAPLESSASPPDMFEMQDMDGTPGMGDGTDERALDRFNEDIRRNRQRRTGVEIVSDVQERAQDGWIGDRL